MTKGVPRHRPSLLRPVLHGQREMHRQDFTLLLGGLAATVLSQSMFVLALSILSSAIAFTRAIAIALLTLAVLLLVLGLRAIVYASIQLGLKRLLPSLAGIYTVCVLTIGLVTAGNTRSSEHWSATASAVWAYARSQPNLILSAIREAPDNIRRARSGAHFIVNETDLVPLYGNAADTTVVPPSPHDPEATPPAAIPSVPASAALSIGGRAKVVRTGEVPLRARQNPSLSSTIIHRFPRGMVVSVIDGPTTADGFTWWLVAGQGTQGWCAQDYLEPIE